MTPRDQGRFWDSVTARDGADSRARIAEAAALIESLAPRESISGCAILDAGCGAGDYAAAFASLGAAHVTGFDLSAGSLNVARQKSAGTFCTASLTAIPYPAETFDLVWAWGVLHYVPAPAEALREMARVVRPGGVVIIHTLRRGPWVRIEQHTARVLGHTPGWMQEALIGIGARIVPLASRLVTGNQPQSAKTIRQKLHERFFVPGRLIAFDLAEFADALGPVFLCEEAAPPVSDLFGRGMSMTVVARRK